MLFRVGLVFWTIDILLGFNTGAYKDGGIVYERSVVVRHYLNTWFLFDLSVVTLDYLFLFLMSVSNFVRVIRGARMIRILRTMRVLRMLKMRKFLAIVEDFCYNHDRGWLVMSAAMAQTMVALWMFAHFFGCSWYFLGHEKQQAGDETWLSELPENFNSISDTYTMSVHWTLSHLTNSPVDANVRPQNVLERIFCMLLTSSKLIILGSVLSKISRTISELNKLEADYADKKLELRRYFKMMGISVELSSRVLRFAADAYRRKYCMTINPGIMDLLS
jgi:hypothetical protein